MPFTCTHLDQVRDGEPRTPDGCEECLQSGDSWVHLRLCLTCGHVGCCDASPNRHATKHFHATKHPIIASFEPDEDWAWCYVDELMMEVPVPQAAPQVADDARAARGRGPGGLLGRLLSAPFSRNYVVGVVDDRAAGERAAGALRDSGFAADDVVVQTGAQLDEKMRTRDLGTLILQSTTEEAVICRDYNEAARAGAVVSAYTADSGEVERARRALEGAGAHSLLHFGTLTITEL
ncbi:MAG TPA: UBP-type zinc finger domain-containing protein [Longimicrobiales bacterium]